MLFMDGAFGLAMVALWIFCLIDVITTDESLCRNLPKGGWLLIVLFLPDIGSVIWLIAGRPVKSASLPYRGNKGKGFPEYERPGRFEATSPDDDEDFLRICRERAEEQRRTYREQKRLEAGTQEAEPDGSDES